MSRNKSLCQPHCLRYVVRVKVQVMTAHLAVLIHSPGHGPVGGEGLARFAGFTCAIAVGDYLFAFDNVLVQVKLCDVQVLVEFCEKITDGCFSLAKACVKVADMTGVGPFYLFGKGVDNARDVATAKVGINLLYDFQWSNFGC